jgi:intracellular multiplication protein IcmL
MTHDIALDPAAQDDKNRALRLWKITWSLVIACGASLAVAAVQFAVRPAPDYVFFAPTGRPVSLQPGFEKPFTSSKGLLQWVTSAVVASRNFTFLNYAKVLERHRGEYAEKTFDLMLQNLQATGTIDKIVSQHLVQTCVPTGPSIITGYGIINHQPTWRVQFPLLVSYQSSQGVVATEKQVATVDVSRADTRRHPLGFVITRLEFTRN